MNPAWNPPVAGHVLVETLMVLAGLCAQEPASHLRLSVSGEERSIPAPGRGEVRALAIQGDHLWLARGSNLYRLAVDTGELTGSFAIPAFTYDLAADERFLYAIDSRGLLRTLDPEAGRVVREVRVLATGAGPRPTGIASRSDELVVLDSDGALFIVDRDGGDARRTGGRVGARGGPQRLAFDGEQLVTCERKGLFLSGATAVDRTVPLLVSPVAVAHNGAEYVLMVERGGVIDDRIYFLNPRAEARSLSLLVVTGAEGRVQWELGEKTFDSAAQLLDELLGIHDDRSAWYRDSQGGLRSPDARIFHRPGVTYEDIAISVDAVTAAGFGTIDLYPLISRNR